MTDERDGLILQAALRVLSQRLILIIGLLMAFVLFAWDAWNPSYDRLGAAVGFAILVLAAHWISGIR